MKNKKILTVICIIVILVIIALIYIAINKTNSDDNDVNTLNTENTLSTEPNIPEDKSLSDLSFNGIKIGDKLEEEMKNLVLDAPYKYEYEKICINAHTNDDIYYLGFFCSHDAQGNTIKSIENVNIAYNGNKLETVSDFKENFGDGTVTDTVTNNESEEYYSIYYYDNDLELYLYIKNDRVINVVLREKDAII